jgi:hypothetical protein
LALRGHFGATQKMYDKITHSCKWGR